MTLNYNLWCFSCSTGIKSCLVTSQNPSVCKIQCIYMHKPQYLAIGITDQGNISSSPSLQAFKARLDVALGSLGCWLATAHSRGLELDEHCGPFQPRPFYDSVILPPFQNKSNSPWKANIIKQETLLLEQPL